MDRTLDPHLTERFGADLAAVWPEAEVDARPLGIAVSGGPDSVALLLLANCARPGAVEVATVDHGLRPESAAEAQWVADLCRELRVRHQTLRVAVETGNLQSKAREARYQALDGWMEHRGLAAVATAHHADDQAETLLMRLNRGSGLSGLAGVRPHGTIRGGGGRVLRPLLGWRKAELAALVRKAGIEPVMDPSNRDSRFDRVRVRQALAGADWLDPLALARSAALLGEAEAALQERVAEVYSRQVTRDRDGFAFVVSGNDYIRVEVVALILEQLGAKPSRSEIARAIARLSAGQNASLAGILIIPSAEHGGERWTLKPEPPRRLG